MNLLIVESPTKAKTISRFLGRAFKVLSSYGHVRDLPKSRFGILIDREKKTFSPEYIVPIKKRRQVKELKKEAEKAAKVILASDIDREGEAIAWHLIQALGLAKSKIKNEKAKKGRQGSSAEEFLSQSQPVFERIAFHEITKSALENALRQPRPINMQLVKAQQARRILDRIVGYKLSPLLWEKIVKGLSAGRVQSVALRLIVDREEEIEAFQPRPYFTVEAMFEKNNLEFKALLFKLGEKDLGQFDLDRQQAEEIVASLKKTQLFTVSDLQEKTKKLSPLPPFTTSTLQQTAWQWLKFPVRLTMLLAQALYERGLITYMRTDSTFVAQEAVGQLRSYLKENYPDCLPETPRFYKTKSKLAQEAHEAVRPTKVKDIETARYQDLEKRQQKLYQLIFKRTLASQMKDALFKRTTAVLAASYQLPAVSKKITESRRLEAGSQKPLLLFKANGSRQLFDGFLRLYPIKTEEVLLPELELGEKLKVKTIEVKEHFTEPPPRFTEASLVKALESFGIGRPSTYAVIVSTVQQRGYVTKAKGRVFIPTRLGRLVVHLLKEHFPKIVDYDFTAKMEDSLDFIAQGKRDWQKVLNDFYWDFERLVLQKTEEIPDQREILEEKCPKCGGNLVRRFTRFGEFVGCGNFPNCNYKVNDNLTTVTCPKCGQGKLVKRRNRKRGEEFYGCEKWPSCNYTAKQLITNN